MRARSVHPEFRLVRWGQPPSRWAFLMPDGIGPTGCQEESAHLSESKSEVDVLYSAEAIASFLSELLGRKITRKNTYFWVETGRIPAGHLGNTVIASKSKLREHVSRIASGE